MDGNSTAPNRVKDPRTIARKYQMDLCKRAVEENIIVYLGTGCGKTHIAVLLMYELGHLIRKPSKSICIFLAPTVPLVRQQAMVIESSTDFKVRCHYGSQKNLKDHDDWNKEIDQSEVLVMTPQILLQNLRHCFIRMDLVALLIFDECHHAQAPTRHPYAQIMREFYKTKGDGSKCPRVFGMTASPIIGKGGTDLSNYTKCINSLENLLDAKVCSVDDESELEGFVASPDIKVYYYGPLFYTASSLTFVYSKKLEDIKVQCISMLKDKLCDFRECQNQIKLLHRLHDNIIFCLEQIGLFGAIRAARKADMPETEIVSINNDNFLIDQYLTKALSILIGDLLDGNNDVDSLTIGALEEPFFSNKLAVLVGILASYRLQATAKCIIFVKRIIVAKSLAYILGSLESLKFWKCEFLVGCHGGKESMSRGKMNTIVERFSSGEVNLLVATNVAEEGLDIQTCCLVVRFDLPETVASFIQSRGRARMTISEYVFLVERGNEREGKLLNDFMAGEDIMNKEITSRTSSETFDDLEEVNYKVSSTGASINTGCSVSLLHRYCDKLPRDKYFTPSPKFYYVDDLNGTICRIILPPNAPLRQVDGLPCSSKDEAKRNACLKACKELHERGALTDYLLPDINPRRKIGPATHHSEYNSNSIEDESSREELYELLVPAALRRSWSNDDTNINLHFYYIRFIPKPKDRQYRMFGLFIKNPLPQEAESLKVDLHLTHGRIVETTLTPQGMTTFDKEEIMLAQNFQEMFLKIILDRSEFYSDLVPLGKCNASQDCSSKSYLLLPVIEQLYEGQKMIDWTTVRCCLTSPAFIDVSAKFEKDPCRTSEKLQLINGSVNKTDVVNSLVFTPHNNLFFFVDGILYETNANSCYKGTKCESYAEYYRDRFHIKLSYPEQPFLKAKQLFVCRNLLHNRVQANTEARELVEHFVELPPELCSLKIVGFSKDIGSTLSLLPSLMHRMENLLVAIELKEVLSSSFPEASEVRADRILEALTTEKCLERLSLERFEVLGDSFLKYAVARHSFLTYEAFDEGQLTRRRSSIVNNSNLYELAIAKKLQVYIRDELFDPTQFFALGRPCKMVCNIDTKSVIHQEENENLNIAAEGHNFRCTKSHHWLHRKTIADVVEALVGAFLVESGFKGAIAFLRWIGISVDFDVSNIYRVWESSNSNLSLISNRNVNELEEILGYTFRCKGLLLQAFVHASYNKHSGGCYQKLEFLGDAVLEYLITSYLYSVFPELKPGQITDLRSITVNNNSFANVAVWRSLHKYLMKDARSLDEAINKFESFVLLSDLEKDLIEEPACPKVLGDIVESCVGAVLLDTGFNLKIVWNLMLSLLGPVLDFSSFQINPLRELRELCQYFNFAMRLPDPVKVGGDYCVKVEADVKDEHLMFTSTNKNSKTARRMAAQEVLSMLKARGYKLKSKPLEDIVQSAKKDKPKLIGYDEEPIVIDNLDSIPLEKLQIQTTEETPHSLGLEKANGASLLNCSGNSWSSRKELTRADASESCNGNHGQIQQTVSDYVEISGTSPGGNHTETAGALAHKTAKSRLMEICATNHWRDPLFECCKEEGPSHLKMFTYKVTVEVEHESSVCLECFSEPRPQKKAAQDHAAEGALWYLRHIGIQPAACEILIIFEKLWTL
ncbi:endoribonuclease Dicer homolog 4 isoform X1 [Musa acuminata AAA Group]|uniref:endoribonuclease Dicer homolog 4 isoform X1 n=1 Tax=Musa acuminata AAA Group TaxID=214697 RepID=UPI0031DB76D6